MEYDVLGLDISVDDLIGVKLVDSLAYLPHIGCHFVLMHRMSFLEELEELASHAEFEDNIDVGYIIKIPIHFDHIRVVQK